MPYFGKNIEKLGKRWSLFVSIVLMGVSTILFASAGFFPNKNLFYGVSLIARLLQGLAEGWFLIACPSILAEAYPEQFELYNGYFQAS